MIKDTTFAGKAQLSGEGTTSNIEKLREYVGLLPHELTDIADKAIDALASQPRWIPCSEELPIDAGHYLCSFKKPNRIDRICVDLAYWTGGRWYGYMADAICAWMPLPAPYEEVK